MSIRSILVAGVLALGLLAMETAPAQADLVTTYAFSPGTETVYGAKLTGTFQVDQSTSAFVSGSVKVSGYASENGSYSFDFFTYGGIYFYTLANVLDLEVGGPFPTSGSLLLSSTNSYIYTSPSSYDFFAAGTLNASTSNVSIGNGSVPEPSAISLLAVGLLGLVLVSRRREANHLT